MGTYEEKYKDLVKRLNKAREEKGVYTFNSVLDAVAPELKIEESEDERIRKKIIKLVKEHSVNHERCQMEAWLEKQGEQQDVSMQINPSEYINDMGGNGCYLKKANKWELVEQKSAWSEEDERIRIETIELLETANHPNKMRSNGKPLDFIENINWLKSLRPQSQWKPSEEQMTALRRMKVAIGGEGEIYEPLNSLYEDLKKLKG